MLDVADLIAHIPSVAPDDRRFDGCETLAVLVPLPRSLFEGEKLDIVTEVLPEVERELRRQVDEAHERNGGKR